MRLRVWLWPTDQGAKGSRIEMKRGFLSDHFVGIAAKRLSAVEANRGSSNQHEFNGTVDLRRILGEEDRTIPAKLLYLTDDEEKRVAAAAELTWYQARK